MNGPLAAPFGAARDLKAGKPLVPAAQPVERLEPESPSAWA